LYSKLNSRSSKRLLFRVGYDAGFFSEYNNMIFTMHYCVVNNIGFILNSNDANFSYKNGWQDYFLPFTSEQQCGLNKSYNTRLAPFTPVRLRDKIGYPIFRYWLKLLNIDYLTWQLLPLARKQNINQIYYSHEFQMNGTFLGNCSKLSNMVWKFQPAVEKQINQIQSMISVNEPYIGFHIRRGDKQKETPFIAVEDYIKKAKETTSIRLAFIATDDYSVYKQLSNQFTDWKFITLSESHDKGYDQISQTRKSKIQIRDEMIRLFAEIEILRKAEYFFGTFSSNISLFLAMHMPADRCIGVDFKEWRIW